MGRAGLFATALLAGLSLGLVGWPAEGGSPATELPEGVRFFEDCGGIGPCLLGEPGWRERADPVAVATFDSARAGAEKATASSEEALGGGMTLDSDHCGLDLDTGECGYLGCFYIYPLGYIPMFQPVTMPDDGLKKKVNDRIEAITGSPRGDDQDVYYSEVFQIDYLNASTYGAEQDICFLGCSSWTGGADPTIRISSTT